MYGPYKNERRIGGSPSKESVGDYPRHQFGIIRDINDPTKRSFNGKPEYVKKQSCDGSLKRLGVDEIDLYYLHRKDQLPPLKKRLELWRTSLTGRSKHIGLSGFLPIPLRRTCGISRHGDTNRVFVVEQGP